MLDAAGGFTPPQPGSRLLLEVSGLANNIEDLLKRLAAYAGELQQLARLSADKQTLLNGDGTRHGLNHLNELWQMLPDGESSKEFRIRE